MLTPITLVRFHLKLKQYNEIISRFIIDTSNRYGIILSYTSLVIEYVPLWTQTFNVTTKNINAKTSPQNDQQNNTEFSNRNINGDRPETQHINQPVNQQQVEIDRLCDVADQGMYRRTHHSPSSIGRLMRLLSMPNVSSVQQRMRNRYDENEHQRYSYNDRRYSFNRQTENSGGRRCSTTPSHERYNNTDNSLVSEALEKNSNDLNLINWQPLATAALSVIKEFDGTNKSSTIPWLDKAELVA